MAANIWRPTVGNNWSDFHNWSLLAVPTANDGNIATFDANVLSGPCSLDIDAVCNAIDFSAYNNTITSVSGHILTVSGNITLGSSMTIAGTGAWSVNNTGTLTSNGKSFPNNFSFTGSSKTFTLADDWTVVGNFDCNAPSATLNGLFNFNVGGNFNVGQNMLTGTATFVANGTGTFQGGYIGNSININTSGTITFVNTTYVKFGKSLTKTAGTVITTGSTLEIDGNYTLDNTITFNNILTGGGTTITVLSNLTLNGNLTISAATVLTGVFNVNVAGSLTLNNNVTGTSTIILNGTGTWSGNNRVNVNLTINTAGTITISGNVNFGLATLLWVAGTTITTSSTLTLQGDTTLNTNGNTAGTGTSTSSTGINWATVNFGNNLILTNSSAMCILTAFTNNTSLTLNGSIVYIQGDLTITSGIADASTVTKVVLNGTGTWSGVNKIATNVDINTNGTITIGDVIWGGLSISLIYISGITVCTGTFTWQTSSGAGSTINVNGSTLNRCGTINNTGINFKNFATNTGNNGNVTGNLTICNTATINTNQVWTGGTVYIKGDFTIPNSSGTTLFVLNGITTLSGNNNFGYNITINTNEIITISGTINLTGTKTLTWLKGIVIGTNSTVNILSDYTFVGANNINFNTIVVTAGKVLTMDYFFQGKPSNFTTIQSTSTSNYTVTFTTTKQLITQFVKISNCTLSQQGRLIISTIRGNQGSNIGIYYYNNDANGFPSNNNNFKSNFNTFGGWMKQY